MPVKGVWLVVYGFGERKTPEAFVKSCDRFITLEVLQPSPEPTPGTLNAQNVGVSEDDKKVASEAKNGQSTELGTQVAKKKTASVIRKGPALPANGAVSPSPLKPDKTQVALVKSAYLATAGEDGWANLASFGVQILRLSPSFDPRTFGCSKLGDFVESTDLFEIKKIPSPKSPLSFSWHIKWK